MAGHVVKLSFCSNVGMYVYFPKLRIKDSTRCT